MSAPEPEGHKEDDDETGEASGGEEEDDDNPQDGNKNQLEGSHNKVEKSAEAKEREIALNANFEKYRDKANEELEQVLPRRPDGTLTSIGALLHASEKCAACSFFHFSMKGCHNGIRCKFCHWDHPKRTRVRVRRRKRPVAKVDVLGAGASGPPAKSARTDKVQPDATASDWATSDLRDVRLDTKGNSRPSWLQDDSDSETGTSAYGSAWAAPACAASAYLQHQAALPPPDPGHCCGYGCHFAGGWPPPNPAMHVAYGSPHGWRA